MMTKVKFFICKGHTNTLALEQQINEFLQSDEFGELVDIKYSNSYAGSDSVYKYAETAIVIYKTK